MRDQEPTIRSRELGDGLRRAIEQAGLNGKQAAHLLGLSPSRWAAAVGQAQRNEGGCRGPARSVPGEGQGAGPVARALP